MDARENSLRGVRTHKYETEDAPRQRAALQAIEDKGMSHRQAERLFREFQRSASVAEIVTSWAGKVE